MNKLMMRTVNAETGEVIDREMTSEEIAEKKAIDLVIAQEQAVILEAAEKRQALLDKLGITEDEARLLLGGN